MLVGGGGVEVVVVDVVEVVVVEVAVVVVAAGATQPAGFKLPGVVVVVIVPTVLVYTDSS